MKDLFEQLLLPYIHEIGMDLSSQFLYRNCGNTFCCNSEIGNGFCWDFSSGNQFSVSVYDFKVNRDMMPTYQHPDFFTIGLSNEHTAKYVLSSVPKGKLISYSMPQGTFSGIFPSGTHVKNASLSFSPDFLKEQTQKYHLDYKDFLNICFSHNKSYSLPDAEFVLKQIFSAHPTSHHADMYYEAKIMELFSVLLQWNEKNKMYADDGIPEDDLAAIHEVISYMNHHLKEPINISDIEKIAYMGKNKLSHLFKLEKGISISEYLRRLRMDKAKEILMNSTIPINLVAQEVGYQNQGSFAERFRMETGMTPSEYRSHCMTK